MRKLSSFSAILSAVAQPHKYCKTLLQNLTDGIYIPSVQAEMLQNFPEGDYKPSVQAEVLQNYQEVEFINHQYRQRYWKIIKRWNLKNKTTGIDIAKSSSGGLQAKILLNFEDMQVFPYKTHSQKYEPT